jgi:hypothetical protein
MPDLLVAEAVALWPGRFRAGLRLCSAHQLVRRCRLAAGLTQGKPSTA